MPRLKLCCLLLLLLVLPATLALPLLDAPPSAVHNVTIPACPPNTAPPADRTPFFAFLVAAIAVAFVLLLPFFQSHHFHPHSVDAALAPHYLGDDRKANPYLPPTPSSSRPTTAAPTPSTSARGGWGLYPSHTTPVKEPQRVAESPSHGANAYTAKGAAVASGVTLTPSAIRQVGQGASWMPKADDPTSVGWWLMNGLVRDRVFLGTQGGACCEKYFRVESASQFFGCRGTTPNNWMTVTVTMVASAATLAAAYEEDRVTRILGLVGYPCLLAILLVEQDHEPASYLRRALKSLELYRKRLVSISTTRSMDSRKRHRPERFAKIRVVDVRSSRWGADGNDVAPPRFWYTSLGRALHLLGPLPHLLLIYVMLAFKIHDEMDRNESTATAALVLGLVSVFAGALFVSSTLLAGVPSWSPGSLELARMDLMRLIDRVYLSEVDTEPSPDFATAVLRLKDIVGPDYISSAESVGGSDDLTENPTLDYLGTLLSRESNSFDRILHRAAKFRLFWGYMTVIAEVVALTLPTVGYVLFLGPWINPACK